MNLVRVKLEKLRALATEAKSTVQPEAFWDDVLQACAIAEAALDRATLDVNEVCGFIGSCTNSDLLVAIFRAAQERVRALTGKGIPPPGKPLSRMPGGRNG